MRSIARAGRRTGSARCVGAALALVTGVTTVPAAAQDGPPPTSVRVMTVQPREMQEHRRVTGELVAIKRSRVATIEPGLVVELPIDEGQRVAEGDVLAVLDQRRLQTDLRRLEAQQEVARSVLEARAAGLELETQDLETLTSLTERRATNRKELADADIAMRIASARYQEAERRDLVVLGALADLARIRLDDQRVTAPMDGVVVDVLTERGQWVAEGDPIAEIVVVGRYEAWLDVPQRFARAVLGGRQPVRVEIDATGRSVGPVAPTIVPIVDPTARTFRMFVPVDDPEGVLAAGMSVTGWVPTGGVGTYLAIPRDALLRNPAGFYVYVARSGPSGTTVATPVQVIVAFAAGDRVAIQPGGLSLGDLVVVEGNERLFPMMPVAPSEEPSEAAQPGTGDV